MDASKWISKVEEIAEKKKTQFCDSIPKEVTSFSKTVEKFVITRWIFAFAITALYAFGVFYYSPIRNRMPYTMFILDVAILCHFLSPRDQEQVERYNQRFFRYELSEKDKEPFKRGLSEYACWWIIVVFTLMALYDVFFAVHDKEFVWDWFLTLMFPYLGLVVLLTIFMAWCSCYNPFTMRSCYSERTIKYAPKYLPIFNPVKKY